MHIIVPLAGPGFIDLAGNIKAFSMFRGEPLLFKVLKERPWAQKFRGEDYIFILEDLAINREFTKPKISEKFNGAKFIFTSHQTSGAALSALMGLAAINLAKSEKLIIDLADIYFSQTIIDLLELSAQEHVDGIIPTFESTSPKYSFVTTDFDQNVVTSIREKVVISNLATAGVYYFSTRALFIEALANALNHQEIYTYNQLFYVSCLYLHLIKQGKTVISLPTLNAVDPFI